MALTREQFEKLYKEEFFGKERRIFTFDYQTRRDENLGERNLGRTLWFYDLILPQFDPKNKKIKIYTTKKTGYPLIIGNADLLKRLFELCDGSLVNEIGEADTGVYWGEYLCDSIGGISAIEIISNNVEKRDITALLFYMGQQTENHCTPHCGVAKDILELGRKGKKVLHFPLGYPYRAGYTPIVDVID